MSNYVRSRDLSRKMGWRPGKPKPLRKLLNINNINKTTRNHRKTSLQLHNRLNKTIILKHQLMKYSTIYSNTKSIIEARK